MAADYTHISAEKNENLLPLRLEAPWALDTRMGVEADGAYAQWKSGGCVGGESVFGDMASPIWEQIVILGMVLLGFLVLMYAGYKVVTR